MVNRRRPALALLILLLLAGCAPGYLISRPPDVPDSARAAMVVIARPSHFVGAAATTTIRIDDIELYELGTGEHVAIAIAVGEHFVSLKTWDPAMPFPVRIYPTETIQAEGGRTYYFRVTPGRISRASDAEGRELVADTKPVSNEPRPEPMR
jgi:hypothetical protein